MSYSSDVSETESEHEEIHSIPSRLRKDAIPSEGPYASIETTKEDFDEGFSSSSPSNFDDLVDFHSDFDENSDMLHELDELDQKESSVVSSLRKQQEKERETAKHVQLLENEFKQFLGMRLNAQPLLTFTNQFPPLKHFPVFQNDHEISHLMKEIVDINHEILNEISEMKSKVISKFGWTEEGVGDSLMDAIAQTGQKIRLTVKKGQVINRPIEQQILSLLDEKSLLIQPTRHRNVEVFGVEEQPDILDELYNDTEFYHKLLQDFVSEQNTQTIITKKKVRRNKSAKREIPVVVDPKVRNFLAPTMKPIPEYADSLFKSLMK